MRRWMPVKNDTTLSHFVNQSTHWRLINAQKFQIDNTGLEADVIFSCGQCNFQTLNRGSYLSHTSEHENFNGQIRKPTRCSNSKPEVQQSNPDYYGEANRMDLVGPIISERVVETIVDLSGAHTLLEVNTRH